MFFRVRLNEDNKDDYGRTSEQAWKEHAFWCLRTVRENKPDDQEQIDYMMNNSPTYLACPAEFRECFSGDAVFNGYCDIKNYFDKFKKYYTTEQIEFVKDCLKIN